MLFFLFFFICRLLYLNLAARNLRLLQNSHLINMSANDSKEFDVIIFGASGLTGRHVTEELSRCVAESPELKWAIAGRNAEKLKLALANVQEYLLSAGIDIKRIPVLEADVQNPSSIFAMCERTKLLLNCVGPYNLYGGEMIVSICVECRTHYIDISAEIKYLDSVQANYFTSARKAGVYVVESCGLGSFPADYGIALLMKKFPGGLNSVEYFIQILEGPQGRSTGHGTFSSVADSFMHYMRSSKYDQEVEAEIFKKKPIKSSFLMKEWIKKLLVIYSCKEKAWCIKFIVPDIRNIKRSQMFRANYLNKGMLIETQGYLKPNSALGALHYLYVALITTLLCFFAAGRHLLENYPSYVTFGIFTKTGPTREQILEGSTRITFYAEGWKNKLPGSMKQTTKPDKKLKLIIAGPEAGYLLTAICMVQAGLTVLSEPEKIPLEGGVYTPGVAFENTSIQERLEKRGVTFTFEEIK